MDGPPAPPPERLPRIFSITPFPLRIRRDAKYLAPKGSVLFGLSSEHWLMARKDRAHGARLLARIPRRRRVLLFGVTEGATVHVVTANDGDPERQWFVYDYESEVGKTRLLRPFPDGVSSAPFVGRDGLYFFGSAGLRGYSVATGDPLPTPAPPTDFEWRGGRLFTVGEQWFRLRFDEGDVRSEAVDVSAGSKSEPCGAAAIFERPGFDGLWGYYDAPSRVRSFVSFR